MSPSTRASLSALCHAEGDRFESRPLPETSISDVYLVMYQFALLFGLLVLRSQAHADGKVKISK